MEGAVELCYVPSERDILGGTEATSFAEVTRGSKDGGTGGGLPPAEVWIASSTVSACSELMVLDKSPASINNKVLDVSTFIKNHPGGNAILKGCGKDATSYFTSVRGHQKALAQKLKEKLTVGELIK